MVTPFVVALEGHDLEIVKPLMDDIERLEAELKEARETVEIQAGTIANLESQILETFKQRYGGE